MGRPPARTRLAAGECMLYRTSALLIGRALSSHLSVAYLRRDVVFAHGFSRARKRWCRRQHSTERERERVFYYNNILSNISVDFTGFGDWKICRSIIIIILPITGSIITHSLAPALLTRIFLFRETDQHKSFDCAHRKHHALIR